MSPARVNRPVLPLTFLQRAAQSIPIVRKLFWTPRTCYADIHDLADASAGEIAVRDLAGAHVEHCFVAHLNPGKLVGDCLLVASRTDGVAGQLQALHGAAQPWIHWVLRRCRYRREVFLPGTSAVLAAASGANYYHWLLESLPRLWLIGQAGFTINQIDRFLLNEELLPFHAQTLEVLGIPQEKRMCARKNRVFRCERLFVPSLPADPMVYPSWALSFLRERFLPAAASVQLDRVFISRRQAARRKLLNEPEIEERLRNAGFKTVMLEELSFREQVGLFASASVMVAPHGAGLSNLVFSQSHTRVIELVSPSFINHCYQKLAGVMQLPYAEVVGDLTTTPRKRAEEDDFMISTEKLNQAMRQLGVK
jgi:capsular polysaccharide biosynthesis protein